MGPCGRSLPLLLLVGLACSPPVGEGEVARVRRYLSGELVEVQPQQRRLTLRVGVGAGPEIELTLDGEPEIELDGRRLRPEELSVGDHLVVRLAEPTAVGPRAGGRPGRVSQVHVARVLPAGREAE